MAYQLPDGYLEVLGGQEIKRPFFSCRGRVFGYYADVTSGCRIFHICQPISDEYGALLETAHFSFFCGNLTVFNQESLTCTYPEDAYPCQLAERLYEISNVRFFEVNEDQTFF
ncbi:U-scoloptoxin(01)-Cw1a-like [Homarus americanus]|uniref:U-scoloptoxin(01)-Cw1a-like n=1 Tax=Homarus americanus TaxID=6706 RepID=UPI001C46B6EA|nr:U-scoloptoxin(01)-Cw1a-like [Homarus americanus]